MIKGGRITAAKYEKENDISYKKVNCFLTISYVCILKRFSVFNQE